MRSRICICLLVIGLGGFVVWQRMSIAAQAERYRLLRNRLELLEQARAEIPSIIRYEAERAANRVISYLEGRRDD